MRRGRPRHDDVLTPREWQVLDLLREGLTNDQIASRLAISRDTAKFHVSEILTKLGVESREEAAAWSGRPRVAFGLGPIGALWQGLSSTPPLKLAGIGSVAAAAVALVLLAVGVLLNDDENGLGKIAFVREGNIWVQEIPDGTPYQLTDKGASSGPRWSPSGEWLLYSTQNTQDEERLQEHWVIRADGSDERLLDSQGFVAYWLPGIHVLPDGHDERLSARSSDDLLAYITADESMVVEEADGYAGTILSAPFVENGERVHRYHFLGYPGDKQIYQEIRYPAAEDETPSYQGIWMGSYDGTPDHVQVVSTDPEDNQLFFLGWSGDGSRILYSILPSTDVGDSAIPGEVAVHAIPVSGGEDRELFSMSLFTHSWFQFYGATLTVAGSDRESWTNKGISLISPDASSYQLLTASDMAAISPAWSPDATQVAYAASPDLGAEGRDEALLSRRIWLMNADGGAQQQLTFGDGFRDEAPQWSNDGRHILFTRLDPSVYCDDERAELILLDVEDGSSTTLTEHADLTASAPVEGQVSRCNRGMEPFQVDPDGHANVQQYLDWWQP